MPKKSVPENLKIVAAIYLNEHLPVKWLFPASPLEGFNFLPSKGCFQGLFEAENEQVDQPKRPLGREGWSWLIFS